MNYLNPKKQSNSGFTRTLSLYSFFSHKKGCQSKFSYPGKTKYRNQDLVSGFTLIELLVVISIIGILASVILISLTGVRQKAKDSKIKSEVYGIKLALEDYNATNGGYPSPEGNDFDNAEHPNLWCIGATDCKIIGELIDEEFPTGLADIAFQEKINNLAAIFPNYPDTISYHDAEGNENKGYVYVSCETPNGKVCHSNTEGNYAYIIYPTTDAVKAIRVGTFEEEVCDLSICENGENNTTDTCGGNNNEACSNYCSSEQSLNYDLDGSGACTGTWFTTDSTALSLGYVSSSGWAGSGYYGESYPTGFSNYNGSGTSCINISSISSSVSGFQAGSYCNNGSNCSGTPNCDLIGESACNANPACSYTPSYNFQGCTGTYYTTGTCTVSDCRPGCNESTDEFGQYTCTGTYQVASDCSNRGSDTCGNTAGCTPILTPTGTGTCSQIHPCSYFDNGTCPMIAGCSVN